MRGMYTTLYTPGRHVHHPIYTREAYTQVYTPREAYTQVYTPREASTPLLYTREASTPLLYTREAYREVYTTQGGIQGGVHHCYPPGYTGRRIHYVTHPGIQGGI